MELDMFEVYNPEDYESSPRRRELSRSPSIDLFPTFDAEPILRRPSAVEAHVEQQLEKGQGTRGGEAKVTRRKKRKTLKKRAKKDQKEWDMRVKMKQRLTEEVYIDETYGTSWSLLTLDAWVVSGNRECLWNVSRSVFEVPQKVNMVPSCFVLFRSVIGKKNDWLNGSDLARKWNRMSSVVKKGIWKEKVMELKEEQQRQIEWGAVRIRTKDDSDYGESEDEGQ